MRSVDSWFAEYDISHKNDINKRVHWICVPLIFFSVIGLSHEVNFPFIASFLPMEYHFFANLSSLIILGGLLFYLRMSLTIFIFMILACSLCLTGVFFLESKGINLWVSLFLFIGAWIGQFIGHHVEGKKPSFLKDLQFLFVGPAWCIAFVFRKIGIPY